MGLFAFVVAVGLFYLSSWHKLPESTPVVVNESSMQAVVTEPEVRVVAEPEVDVADEVVPEPDTEIVGESEIDVLVEVIPEPITNSTQTSVTKTVPEVESRPVGASDAEIISDTDIKIDSQYQAAITQQPDTVTNLAAVMAEEMNTTGSARTDASADELNQSGPTRFQRKLQASMEWINRNDNSIGKIQIMLLSFENFDVKGFYKYVDYLTTQQVDTSKLRFFKTYTGNRKTYSVFYGEYESWKAAGNAKSNLPEVLRKNSPIQRSVGGIIQEIRQLEAEN